MLVAFIRDDEGAIVMEYGLITALIAVLVVGSMIAMSAALKATFIAWSTAM